MIKLSIFTFRLSLIAYRLSLFAFIFTILLLIYNSSFAQHSSRNKEANNIFKLKGLSYGFNFGAYIPSNKTANYYNGDSSHTLSLYRSIIDRNYFYHNQYYYGNYDSIRNKIFNHYDFVIKELPQHMRYSVAINIGFYTKYNFNDNLGIYFEINYSKLKTTDKVSIDVLNTAYGSIQAPYFYDIMGKESRVDINLGVMKSFGTPRIFKPYIEGAFNLNNTRVLSADINFDYTENGITKNLTYSYLNQYNQYYSIRDDGIGYGIVAGGGIQTIVNQTIVLYTGFDLTLKKIHLGENNKFNLNSFIYFRFLFHNLITTKPEA